MATTRRDRMHLGSAMEVALAPLEHSDSSSWLRALNRAMRDLVGADAATFHVAAGTQGTPGGFPEIIGDELGSVLDSFTGRYYPMLDARFNRTRRAIALGVSTPEQLYGEAFEEYRRTPFYNEYLRAQRLTNCLGAAFHIPWCSFTANIYLHSSSPFPSRAVSRGAATLRLLLPAIQAGVEMQVRAGRQRADVLRQFEVLGDAVLAYDMAGREVHRTSAVEKLLRIDEARDQLLTRARRLAGATIHPSSSRAAGHAAAAAAPEMRVRTPRADYSLRASLLDPGASTRGRAMCLVSIRKVTPEAIGDEEIRMRWKLTPAEIRVARRLGSGESNAAIAAALGISPHTAERHTERVLHKLGVRSRAAVGQLLLGAGRHRG